jgi:hypothetical protein
MKKLALAAFAGGVLSLGSLIASADTGSTVARAHEPAGHQLATRSSAGDSPFPETPGPVDRFIEVSMTASPFPETYGPVDRMAPGGRSDSDSPFPKTYGPIDRSVDIAMPQPDSPFPKEIGLARVTV